LLFIILVFDMYKFFFILAWIGLILSVIVHVSSIFEVISVIDSPFIWFLHIGIFLVFLPALLKNKQKFPKRKNFDLSEMMNPFRSVNQLTKGIPPLMIGLVIILMIYAFINFAYFIADSHEGQAELRNGKYLLVNHGKVVRELDYEEYKAQKSKTSRGFSGHWMVFYCVSAALLWPGKPENKAPNAPIE
jgi:hypothetical protein